MSNVMSLCQDFVLCANCGHGVPAKHLAAHKCPDQAVLALRAAAMRLLMDNMTAEGPAWDALRKAVNGF